MTERHELGDAPVESVYVKQMNALAMAMDEFFNGKLEGEDRHTGFILMVFPFGSKDGRCNYISNGADRNDVVKLMKEQIKNFEGADNAEKA